jgi:hypothetical protein
MIGQGLTSRRRRSIDEHRIFSLHLHREQSVQMLQNPASMSCTCSCGTFTMI